MKIELKPDQIPQFTGDLTQLDKDHAALKADAGHLRGTGSDVHSHFQGLSAYYKAPEAEKLFASTKPVKDRADAFAGDLETVASALSAYADEIRPLVPKLARLKTEAQDFIRDHKDDEDGDYDGDLIAEHNRILNDITATVAAFWAAERTCHNKITALWGGTQMVAGDGSGKENQYGFSADDMEKSKELPWGEPVEEKHHWWEIGYWLKSFFWDGLIVDGIWGTIKGLGTLLGFNGWEAAGRAWKGLGQLITGLAISVVPGVNVAFWSQPDDQLPSWLRDSRTAMKETGKALVAWDQWGENPGRAAGAVTFNVLTTVFTGGAGAAAAGAGRAGAVARALSAAGRAGRLIDPMTYVGRAAGAGLSRIGDAVRGLRGAGRVEVPDLAADAARLPDDATRLPTGPGEPVRYFDGEGRLLDAHGNVLHEAADAPRERVPDVRPASADAVPEAAPPAREPALVGAGTHAADATPPAGGGHTPPPADGFVGDGTRAPEGGAGSPHEGGAGAPHEGGAESPHDGAAGAAHEGAAGASHEGSVGSPHEGDGARPHEGGAGSPHEGDAVRPHEGGAGEPHEGDAPPHGHGGGPDGDGRPADGADGTDGASGGDAGASEPGGLPPKGTGGDDPEVIRQDDDFGATHNTFGLRKSRFDPDIGIVPAKPDGTITPLEHVLGGANKDAKEASQFTSFAPRDGTGKVYGAHEVSVDYRRLQADIDAGRVRDVEIWRPERIQQDIAGEINKAAGKEVDVPADLKPSDTDAVTRFVKELGLSKSKTSKVQRRVMALLNTRRDGEWLISGIVPKEYVKGPYPTART
ncbi:hypothetical protein [Streptomyces sp. Ru73]|uniref:hypothetical protein n=1 Tax=Streptomyces sp. Ru73 TaxID=2080748 RepID=UPI002155FB12|nr:hypothetical protein [Streptomyces sp. Ru73]